MAESKMPANSPSDNLLAFAITETFGEPCVTADVDCYTCQAWAQYNRLRYRADLVEPLVEALRAHDAYMAENFSDGPDSKALHPKAAANWKRVRAALSSWEAAQ